MSTNKSKAPAKKSKKSDTKPAAKSAVKPEPEVKQDAAPVKPLPDAAPSPAEKPEPKTVNLDSELVQRAIAEGGALIKAGKSKADAARAIYVLLKDEPRDVVIEAFIQGATITPKGAPTYFYNVSRKFKRDQAKGESKPADPPQ
jgi:hypothetical protein